MPTVSTHPLPSRLSWGRVVAVAFLGTLALSMLFLSALVMAMDPERGIPEHMRMPAIAERLLGLTMVAWIPGMALLVILFFTRRKAVGVILGSLIVITGSLTLLAFVLALIHPNSRSFFGEFNLDWWLAWTFFLAPAPLLGLMITAISSSWHRSGRRHYTHKFDLPT